MKNLFAAIAAFQDECPILVKAHDSSDDHYKYITLPELIEQIKPLLTKHKLGFSQPPSGKSIKTIVFHTETGEFIKGKIKIPQNVRLGNMNDFQVLGSAFTYLRRYSLSSILGIVAESDNDAQGRQRRDNNEIPEGATLVPATSATKPESNATQVTKAPASQNGATVPPAFSQSRFNQFKPDLQNYLNEGMSHDAILSNIRKNFLMIEPKIEQLIREMKKELPVLTEDHKLYAGVIKSLESKNQSVDLLKNYFTIPEELETKLLQYAAS